MSMPPRDKTTICRTAYVALLAAFGAVHAVIYYLYPWMTDDVWYSYYLHDYLEGLDTAFPWQAILDTWTDHYMTDNGRLGNILLPLLLIAPKWIAATALGGFTAWIAAAMTRLAPGRQRSLSLLTLAMLLVSFALPWHECMFGICYGLNYIVPSALMLVAVRIWMETEDRHIYTGWLLCLVIGFWHEGFAVPLGTGLAASMIFFRSMRSWKRVGMIACLLPGFAWLVSSPGFFHDTESYGLFPPLLNWAVVAKLHVALIIYLILVCVDAMRQRRIKIDTITVITLGVALMSMYINVRVLRGERPSWPSHVMASAAIVALCGRMLPTSWLNLTKRSLIAIIAVIALLTVHFGVTIHYTLILRRGMDHAVDQLRADPHATAFTEITLPEQQPVIAWRKPMSEAWNPWVNHNLARYFRIKDALADRNEGNVMIAPEALRKAGPKAGHPVAGGTALREIDGHMFLPADKEAQTRYLVDLGVVKKITDVELLPFKADDGKTYYYVVPRLSYFPYFFFRPVSWHYVENAPDALRYIFDIE